MSLVINPMTLYNFSGQCSDPPVPLCCPSPSPPRSQHDTLSACSMSVLSLSSVALGAVKMPTGDSWTTEREIESEGKGEGGRWRVREGHSGSADWGSELRCHSHSHLRRVNYVLFIIMRSTHALTTLVSNSPRLCWAFLAYPLHLPPPNTTLLPFPFCAGRHLLHLQLFIIYFPDYVRLMFFFLGLRVSRLLQDNLHFSKCNHQFFPFSILLLFFFFWYLQFVFRLN